MLVLNWIIDRKTSNGCSKLGLMTEIAADFEIGYWLRIDQGEKYGYNFVVV